LRTLCSLLIKELEDQDMREPIFDSCIEEQNGEEGQELSDCITSMAEPVYEQYREKGVDAIVEKEIDFSIVTRAMKVPKQEMEDDKQHKRTLFPTDFNIEG